MALTHVALALWIGLSSTDAFQDPQKIAVIVSASFYLFGCIVAPLNCLLLYKALRPILGRRKTSLSQGVQIHVSLYSKL